MTGVLLKRENLKIGTREGDHAGVMLLRAKELPELGEGPGANACLVPPQGT